MRNMKKYLLSLLAVLSAASCIKYEVEWAEPDNGDMVYIGLGMTESEDVVVTRAAASEIEKVIYIVRILAFDNVGTCFYNKEVYNGYESKAPYETSRAFGIPKQADGQYKNCTIWVLANIGDETGVGAETDYDALDKVSTLADLEKLYGYRLLQGSSLSQRDCLSMTGKVEGVDMTKATSSASPVKIDMERILARVTFTVKTGAGYEFYFNDWSVESLPRYSYIIPHKNGSGGEADFSEEGKPAESYGVFYPSEGNNDELGLVTYGVSNWLHEIEEKTYGFYMYENRRGGRLDSPDRENLLGEEEDYAQDILGKTDGSGTDPKFKTYYAPANASFLIITGLVRETATQNVSSFAYKIALGANNYNDYNILRNHNYIYNISINGMTYDDVTVDVFDSRVHKAYALQVRAPYSTQMDAHYDKRYLDITASSGTVKVQLFNTQEDAESGNNPITKKSWLSLSDMDTYNIGIDPDEASSKELVFNDTQRQRLYIYTDENLSTSSRSAVVRIIHTPDPGSSEIVERQVVRYYTFTQAGVIEVKLDDGRTLLVESYEEYGMNLDPYSGESPVQGLQWGWSGTAMDEAVYDMVSGQDNTASIVGHNGNPGDFENGSLYKDYAARYCDNKNKRDADGNVIANELKWYLPAIDELILLTSSVTAGSAAWSPYTMAGKEYWSSTVPTENEVTTNPFQERLDNATWDWLFWAVIYEAWEVLLRNRVTDSDSDYHYTKVAKAAKDGIEVLDVQGSESDYNLSSYYRRIESKHVRAVRIKK